MEQFLSLVGMQAMKLAVRSGIVFTSSYALKQYSHLLTTVSDEQLSDELRKLQGDLDCKIQIITPAINLIELRSGQGNSALESALALTTSIQKEIALLGRKIASLTAPETNQATIRRLMTDVHALIDRINGSIPLLQLAISTSGESLSTSLPDSVSPSRMLQASAFHMIADSHFMTNPRTTVQVGPDFVVSVYMIFKGYSYTQAGEASGRAAAQSLDLDNVRKPTWQEVLHKARLRLHRTLCPSHQKQQIGLNTPSAYSYQLEIAEDRDDGRLHDTLSSSAESSASDLIPLPEITKLLYTNSAAILNIKDDLEACGTPILLLKRETASAVDACKSPRPNTPPEDDTQHHVDCQILGECSATEVGVRDGGEPDTAPAAQSSQFPSYLDPEWIALEMYPGNLSDDNQPDQSDTESTQTESDESELGIDGEATDNAVLDQPRPPNPDQDSVECNQDTSQFQYTTISSVTQSAPPPNNSLFSSVTTSLSLLELVIRLAALQETQQQSHLSVPDHVLTCFLSGNSAAK
ncbi:Ran GTP-binding protein [Cordyceps fumosorosea ARSEF 2679]|uniref:Ran GTP-binding protein n=1 Tax=Cordyceps fumosorosea (strain ARSEF 2679) TaxID=1081104 RepID=A0A168BTI9_CORFA|nr:Ran GTP-binding protein [Cordyceps fumosorosea ARSEF 2679]OAA70531.1 Ran GTP-binding protein [Cordyceps fumosorosea ARSEF 2679]